MSKKILVAEDEPNLRKLIHTYFSREGFGVTEASDGEEAVDKFFSDSFDLVMLDIMMPKKDGLQVCREIRSVSDVPIIMLTARSQEYDELGGFACGADEYITKPFSPAILTARVKAVLKRSGSSGDERMTRGKITLYPREHVALLGDEPLELTPKEYDLLEYLMKNPNIALAREKIIESVWGYDYDGDDRTVDTHIKCLRGKLKEEADMITTIRKHGYMLKVDKNDR